MVGWRCLQACGEALEQRRVQGGDPGLGVMSQEVEIRGGTVETVQRASGLRREAPGTKPRGTVMLKGLRAEEIERVSLKVVWCLRS